MNRRCMWLAAVALLLSTAAWGAEWRAGVAKVDITPSGPIWMAGYAARNHPSEGVAHPLWVKALVIEDQQASRVVLVTADLIGLERSFCDAVAERVRKSTGIPRERLVFNTSHTHSGPMIENVAPIAYDLDAGQTAVVAAYRRTLEDKVTALVEQAVKALAPAQVAFGEGKATFAKNRRVQSGKGVTIGTNAAGPVDHVVPVLAVRDAQGRLQAALFGYACHNTTLGLYEICGDYAGFAQIALEKAHPNATALFMIGCGGDSNPDPRRTMELAEQHGRSLAAAVDEALGAKMTPLAGPLRVAFERVDLPFVAPPSKEELQQKAAKGNVYEKRLTKRLLDQLERGQPLATSYPCPIQVVSFGNGMTMVALAGEVCVDYALRLRKELPGQRLWIAGFSNEVFAYIPSERVLKEGGYEGGGAMVYFGIHGPFQPGLEDKIVGTVKRLATRP